VRVGVEADVFLFFFAVWPTLHWKIKAHHSFCSTLALVFGLQYSMWIFELQNSGMGLSSKETVLTSAL